MKSAEALVDAALAHGDKRSAVYRQGAVDVLLFKLEGRRIQAPYRAGTVEFDAYFSGNDRGWAIWRRFNEEKTEKGIHLSTCRELSRQLPKKSRDRINAVAIA